MKWIIVNIPKLWVLGQISSYKWEKFIVKPIGGCEGHGCGSLLLSKDIVFEPTKLVNYFIENADFYGLNF